MYVNPEVFKAYDIRGNFPDDINAKSAYVIARAFIEYLRSRRKGAKPLEIVLSHDGRPSSPEIKKGVMDALLEEGVTIYDMGFSTSPFHYYSVIQIQADGGIMVTASHNPQRMNGLKLSRAHAEPLGDEMEIVKNIAHRGIFEKYSGRKGVVVARPLVREYVNFLIAQVDLSQASHMKVVLDGGGGMAGILLPLLVKKLPCETIVINKDMTYASAYTSLNPSKEEDLADLKNTVVREHAHFGVAFDADSDRSGFVTHNARFFRADYCAAYFAREFLARSPGATMIYDVRSSNIFRETIIAKGGRAVESRVGHSFIKALMREHDALFAAELSGHFYFKSCYSMDSDFLSFLYFLQFLSQSSQTSDEILQEFERYPSSGELSFKISARAREHILEKIAGEFPDAKDTRWVDGLSLYYDDWWANIRLSNTENCVRLNVEAREKKVLEKKIRDIETLLT